MQAGAAIGRYPSITFWSADGDGSPGAGIRMMPMYSEPHAPCICMLLTFIGSIEFPHILYKIFLMLRTSMSVSIVTAQTIAAIQKIQYT